jgi:hypothetical protein
VSRQACGCRDLSNGWASQLAWQPCALANRNAQSLTAVQAGGWEKAPVAAPTVTTTLIALAGDGSVRPKSAGGSRPDALGPILAESVTAAAMGSGNASAVPNNRPRTSSTGFSNGGVTVRRDTAVMQRRRSQTAVCILRVEVESWGVMFTLTVNRDVAAPTAEPVTHFANAREAAAAVAEFLESFTPCNQA